MPSPRHLLVNFKGDVSSIDDVLKDFAVSCCVNIGRSTWGDFRTLCSMGESYGGWFCGATILPACQDMSGLQCEAAAVGWSISKPWLSSLDIAHRAIG